jgi:hypothetical protein
MDRASQRGIYRSERAMAARLLDASATSADAAEEDALEAAYERILRDVYGMPPAAIARSEIDLARLPRFTDLQAAEEYVFRRRLTTPPDGAFANGYWQRILADLLGCMPRTVPIRAAAFFVGEVPNPAFNAAILPSGDGRRQLILVNKGFMLFAFRFVRLLVAATRFHIRGGAIIERELDIATARVRARADLDAMLDGRHTAEPFHFGSASHTHFSTHLVLGLELFTLAHELGHAMNGFHPPTSPLFRRRRTRRGYVRQRPYTPQQRPTRSYVERYQQRAHCYAEEFGADFYGYLFYRQYMEKLLADASTPEEREDAAAYYAAAPHILFRIAEAFERAARTRHRAVWATHPPAVERQRRVFMLQAASGFSDRVLAFAAQTSDAASALLAPDDDATFPA